MKKRFVVSLLSYWVSTGTPVALGQESLRPEWVVTRAAAQSPALDAAGARIRAARARVAQVGSLDDPMVMARIWSVPLDVISAAPGQIMLMAQQSVPLGSVRGDRERVEATRIQDAETDRLLAHHAVLEEAELAFVADWEASRRAEALRGVAELAGRLRDVTIARIGAGAAVPADVAIADVELARANIEVETALLAIEGAEAALRVLLALPPSAHLGTPAEIRTAATLEPLEVWLRRAERDRPERRLPRSSRARATALRELASSDGAPVLTVGGGVMFMPHEEQAFDQVQWMIELGLSLPIWRGARNGRADEALALTTEAQAADAAWRRSIAVEVTTAWERARIARARAAAIGDRLVPAARTSLNASMAQYSAGGGLASTVDALRTLAALQVERVRATADALRAEVMLSHAAGHLSHRFEHVAAGVVADAQVAP